MTTTQATSTLWSRAHWRRLHQIYLDSHPGARTYWLLKRAVDFSIATIVLLLISPLLIAIAVAIRTGSRGPILFRQERSGLLAKSFTIYKFRTMVDGAVEHGPKNNTFEGDPRVTRLGKLLREYHLDELPQLLNVLKGDMSIVGPRPLMPLTLPQYTDTERRRLFALPGITSWNSVTGGLGNPEAERFRREIWYVDHLSFWLDLKILLRTIPTVLNRDGIYDEELNEILDLNQWQ